MTIERRLARAEITLTRDYPASVDRVWDAFADEKQKLGWWGGGSTMEARDWAFDFRVGGRDIAEGKFHNGPVSRYEATYTDIVEHNRIVTTYDMWLDGVVRVCPDRGGHPIHPRRARSLLRPVLC